MRIHHYLCLLICTSISFLTACRVLGNESQSSPYAQGTAWWTFGRYPERPLYGEHPRQFWAMYYYRAALYHDFACSQYKDAICNFSHVLEDERNFPEAYYYRGRSYAALGQLGKAVEDYQNALKLDPTFHLARVYLAQAQISLHQVEQAKTNIEVIVQANPKSYLVWKDLSLTTENAGMTILARKCREKVQVLKNQLCNDAHQQGNTYLGIGLYRDAIWAFDHAIAQGRKAEGYYQTLKLDSSHANARQRLKAAQITLKHHIL